MNRDDSPPPSHTMSQVLLAQTPNDTHAHGLATEAEWFRSFQKQSAASYEAEPLPSPSDESWRFGDFKALDFSDCAPARPVSAQSAEDILKRSPHALPGAAKLIFANDRVLHSEYSPENGPVFLPLAEAIKSHGDLIQRHLRAEPGNIGSRKFALLNLASLRSGTFLYIPKGCRISEPLHVFHWLAGSGQMIFPHTLVIADEESSATVVDWYESADSGRHMACAMTDIWLKRGSAVNYVSVQQWNSSTGSYHSCHTHVGTDASASTLGLHFGGRYSRFENVSRLLERGARSEMYGMTIADSQQHFDQRTLQDHLSPDTYSNLLFKNALYDSSKAIFSGLIRVGETAHRTDAYQKVRNLLLSDQAEANALPGLEILADQVRCSHGATTGEIDRDELFYLQSRGIPQRKALGLITGGFLGEVLQKVANPNLLPVFANLLNSRLLNH